MDAKLVEFSNLLRQNGLRVSLAESMDMLRALAVVGLPDRQTVRATLRATMVKRSVDLPTFETLFDLFFSGLADAIKSLVRGELQRQDVTRGDQQRLQALAEKSFYYLSEEEIRRMQEAVTKLAQRLRNVVSIRRKRARRGKFDSSDTMRKNLQYGGVPFRIVFDRKRKEKPQVMVLCDVSDSVRNVSRFMLQFVYSLQDLYSKVRSFIFVAEVGEITRLFQERAINAAIDAALHGEVLNVYA